MHPDRAAANYLIFSDVHLGADLVQHVRPWTLARLRQVARIDRDLSSMLNFYRAHHDPARPWRLVIAGDLVDFIGMSIAPEPTHALELSAEERTHGLGSTGEHAAAKMRAVVRRHTLVFESLARFIAEGHSLVLVRGNHDVDFHWEAARSAFVEALVERVPSLVDAEAARAGFEQRVEFYPWFYYVEGLLYVEHGHQFDAMCGYQHLLHPVSPDDPRRTSWSFSDVLLRQVVRPTRGLGSEGHEKTGLFHYLRLAASMGVLGALRLGYRYVRAIAGGLASWWAHRGARLLPIKAEHERRMEEVSHRFRVGLEKVRALSALWARPVTRGVLPVMRSVFFDVVLATLLTAFVLMTGLLVVPAPWDWLGSSAFLAGAVAFVGWSRRLRGREIDPTQTLRLAAERIADLIDAKFVVMGHTHEPVIERMARGSTYVNLGGWASDDVDAEAQHEATRTHLVLRFIEGEHQADFVRWDSSVGTGQPVPVPGLSLARSGGRSVKPGTL